ncbi:MULTISPECIES: YbjN domain-containing protein [Marinobacterium]|jgi:hypothetical protein|uniref:Sensory transduction regulator n=1 Tax=Marinobacterium iners DSM 11526 TaxID=1122198 RepID=A0A1H4DAS7_9GAMM|nr:YbjN domain-containing protein [Marinobacterium iners]SEA69648.1 Putative sensory transduction regulator [Marinobacterium iners DSM 11526]
MKAASILLLAAGVGTMSNVTGVQASSLVEASDPEKIVQLARGFGSATLGTDDYGDPLITGRIDSNKYGIYFYNCEDNKDCENIVFSAAWADQPVSLQRINEWNETQLFGTAYLDEDGDPNIDMPVNLKYGVSSSNFDDTIDWWMLTMKEFEKYIQDN